MSATNESNIILKITNAHTSEVRRIPLTQNDCNFSNIKTLAQRSFGFSNGEQHLSLQVRDPAASINPGSASSIFQTESEYRPFKSDQDQAFQFALIVAKQTQRPLYIKVSETTPPRAFTPTTTRNKGSQPKNKPKRRAGKRIMMPEDFKAKVDVVTEKFPTCTVMRAVSTLIKWGGNLANSLADIDTLQAQGQLSRDGKRRRRHPTKYKALYFPMFFKKKVWALEDMGFTNQKQIINVLIKNGGSVTHATLELLQLQPKMDKATIESTKMAALESSIVATQDVPSDRYSDRHIDSENDDYKLPDFIKTGSIYLEQMGYSKNDRSLHIELLCKHGGDTRAVRKELDRIERERKEQAEMIKIQQEMAQLKIEEAKKKQMFVNMMSSLPSEIVEALSLLNGMGFTDTVRNISLLDKHKGSIDGVINELTGQNRSSIFWRR
mmetsp:Transcript_470/g.637  ORF Transcript_470/g.637 Transcript_470/m.637 type:complete len:437 (-) Transcript_470:117-1427(-)|eukprot:CAMPEP_0201554204 /NCGR_PEP_ID=MMETSP0173_2-20130828/38849_1 /ASSEMBLY_ACC=CAM_ASM_000268 /TAXON_ID=218659 /ORGANISM="Vexillifera sp., Strain DIVA3 564/2" /LENGTH=436 /DNA_ID=CAMNT_0047965401 /DNA_START=13 /DNA_END=1323 /DNA_ORIENTATION=-